MIDDAALKSNPFSTNVFFNPYLVMFLFYTPRKVFLCFQGLWNGDIGKKWVNFNAS